MEAVRYAKNEEHTGLSGPEQHYRASAVSVSVQSISIAEEACVENLPWATKASALAALLQSDMIVFEGDDAIGHEIRKRFQWDTTLVNAMSSIVDILTAPERELVCEMSTGQHIFGDDLLRLWELGTGYGFSATSSISLTT